MRLIVGGGRAVENSESKGAVVVGVRTLSEGGRVGTFSREQVCQAQYYLILFPRDKDMHKLNSLLVYVWNVTWHHMFVINNSLLLLYFTSLGGALLCESPD